MIDSMIIILVILMFWLLNLELLNLYHIDRNQKELIKHIRTTDPLLRRLDAQTRRIK